MLKGLNHHVQKLVALQKLEFFVWYPDLLISQFPLS